MDFETFVKIDEIVKHYTGAYAINGKSLVCHVNDEEKEFLLNDLDLNGIFFSHEYSEGRLEVTFK